MWTHKSQIKYVLRIILLRIVYCISYPLKLCNIQRVLFWCGIWEISFLYYNWVCLALGYLSCFCTYYLKSHMLVLSAIWYGPWGAWISYVKIYNCWLWLLLRKRRDEWIIHLEDLFTFCIINVYVFECFRCLIYMLLSRSSLIMLTYSLSFTVFRIIFHHPCTW